MYYDKLCDLGIKLTRRAGQESTKCPQCSESRKNKASKPLSVNITNGDYCCHHCGWKGNVRTHERKREDKIYDKPPADVLKNISLKEKVVSWFERRAISISTMEKFMIFSKSEYMPQTQKEENCICFPYFKNGELVNIKYRDGAKNFKLHKNAELIFFNLQSVGDKKHCIVVEGEIDCMAGYESGFGKDVDTTTGEVGDEELSKWVVISVPNGAVKGNQRMDYLENCSDWFENFQEIVIAVDDDEAGHALKDEFVRRLGVEKCRIVVYPKIEVVPDPKGKRRCKDINEVLQYLGKESVVEMIKGASFIPIDGVCYLEDIYPSMLANFKAGVPLAPTTRFGEMDDYFRWKKGDLNLFVGYGNHGKTFFSLQLMLTKSIWDGWKWAVFSPENYPANDFYDDLVEMHAGKWLNNMTEMEYERSCNFVGNHIFYVYPEDSHDITSINERFRHLVLKKGIDGVLVDPWNQLDHLQKPYQRDDQYLSELLKDIKRFSLLNGICYSIITHPKNPTYNQDKSLPVVDMYDIAGGAMWGNKIDNIVSYYRPNFHSDKNDPNVQIYIQKVKRKRTGGKQGDFPLVLDWDKKRYRNPVSGEIPCNPDLVQTQTLIDFAIAPMKSNGWKPYKDNDEDVVDF